MSLFERLVSDLFEKFLVEQRDTELISMSERLCHLFEPAAGFRNGLFDREIAVGVEQVLTDPFGQFGTLVGLGESLIGEAHDTVVVLAT